MKKLLAMALMLATAASCEKHGELFTEGNRAPMITASTSNDEQGGVRTTITVDDEGVGTIWWKPGDLVSIFIDKTNVKYFSLNTEDATTAIFDSNVIIGSTEGSSNGKWGLYPYDAAATCDGSSVITTIPAAQNGVPDTFDDNLFPMLAHSATNEMTFYNVCGGIKFSLSRDDIKKITFKGNNDENLAGKVKLTMDESGRPSATAVTGEKTITLTPKTGSTFAKNTNYYLVMLPTVLTNGFTMTFETESQIGTFNYTEKAVTISRSKFGRKTNIDSYATFVDKPEPAIDLSASGTANCYIVSEKGTYKFKAVQGNTDVSVGEVKGVKVLWESFGTNVAPSVGDLIKPEVSYADGYITFSTNDIYKKGNAVIAAYSDANCTDGNVLWSWHIWLSGIAADDMIAQTWNNVGAMLDRNIGAISKDVAYGDVSCLMYQGNRKDPFLGGCFTNRINNNVPEYARMVANINWPQVESGTFTYEQLNAKPTTFVSGSLPTGGWSEDDKGIMDPCPPGYKIPGEYYYVSLLESYEMSESPYRDVSHYGTDIYKNGYQSLWFPYTKKLDFANNWINEYHSQYADGLLWTANRSFLHRIYDGEMYPVYSSSSIGAAAVRCIKESSSPIALPQSIELCADTVIVNPGSSFTMSASLSPKEANVQTISWSSDGFNIKLNENQRFYTGNECQITTGRNIGKYNIKIESPLARRWVSNDPLSKNCVVMNCPSEPVSGKYESYGGWYIYAKAGDTFSFHLDVGTSDDGANSYYIYVGEEIVKNDFGYSGYHIDFNHIFSDTFEGWLWIQVGWGFKVRDIRTTAIVKGRGNKWGNDVDHRMSDYWAGGTPSYIFQYENSILTIK